MAEDWSSAEVAATVADYFVMLGLELRGEPYGKREHNRRLQGLLNGRSASAIEFKHANISAVLIELGFPCIDGYKRRSNYQEALREEVAAHLDRDAGLKGIAGLLVEAVADVAPADADWGDIFVPAPVRERTRGVYERRPPLFTPAHRINYLEREARNASLGAAGEALVLQVEHRRLWTAGQRQLADRIEHVSRTKGDGLGYDILSFDEGGRERLIEVKTTAFGSMTPFFASAKEVATSESLSNQYHLYRVFKFREAPRVFALQGSLRESCVLDAVQYRASLP
jgi:hypothetical protein